MQTDHQSVVLMQTAESITLVILHTGLEIAIHDRELYPEWARLYMSFMLYSFT